MNIQGESYRLKDRLKTGALIAPPADIPAAEHLALYPPSERFYEAA